MWYYRCKGIFIDLAWGRQWVTNFHLYRRNTTFVEFVNVHVLNCLPWGKHQPPVSVLVVRSRSLPTSLTVVCQKLHIMDFVDFADVSFLPNSSIGRLRADLNKIVRQGICYDTFQVQNTECLWLVNHIVTTINSDKVLCGCFGFYPCYVAGILNCKGYTFLHARMLKVTLRWIYGKMYCSKKCSVSYTPYSEDNLHS